MRMNKFLLPFCMVLSLLFFPFTSSAPGAETFKVGIYQNKPLIFRDADGSVRGIYADFLNAVAKENDFRIEWVDGTFAEGLEGLERGNLDLMTAIAWTAERSGRFDFTRKAVISNWGVFYVPKGITPESILDLDGKRVAIGKNDVYAEAFRELASRFGIQCFLIEVADYPDVFVAIEDMKADAGLVSRLYGFANEKDFLVERTNLLLEPTEIRFAVPKGRNMSLLQVMDFNLIKMRMEPNSALNRSIQAWLYADTVAEYLPGWFPWALGLGFGGFLAVLLVSLLLRRQVVSRTKELMQNRRELSREKLFFEKLFEESPDALVLESVGGNRIIRVNKGFTSLFGYSRDEAEGKTLNGLVVPVDFLKEGSKLDEKANSGMPVYLETIRKKKDGSQVDVSIVSVPIHLKEGLYGSYTIYRDITSSREARRVLIESRERISENLERMRRTWEQTIDVLASASETRDPYTAGHQRRVSVLAEAIAMELGLEEDTAHSIRMAGLVHDIGKINVPAEILSKPGALGKAEFDLIKTHPEIGHEIIKNIELPWKLADIILQHHERIDGSGYPAGLKGDEIMIEARIIAVADVVEAMSSHRPYRASRGIDAALNEIEAKRGLLFSSDVVDACLRLFREKGFAFPAGS